MRSEIRLDDYSLFGPYGTARVRVEDIARTPPVLRERHGDHPPAPEPCYDTTCNLTYRNVGTVTPPAD